MGLGTSMQGCQMVYYETKNRNLGKFCRVFQWKMLAHFRAIWSILQPFGILCDILYDHLLYFSVLVCCSNKNLAALHPGLPDGLFSN
jgi:hypothetical protein